MKILFHENQLSYRGTTTSLFDYAWYNQEILGNESVILYQGNNPNNFQPAIDRFSKNFEVYSYTDTNQIDNVVKATQSDLLYVINSGKKDNVISYNIKTVIHAVFKVYEPYGDVYAYVSEWLSQEMTGGIAPFVPHMINLPNISGDLREELGIPEDALVFGRYGGEGTFDLKFVHKFISKFSRKNKNIYFLFMGTKPFVRKSIFRPYKNIIFLPANTDLNYKTKFINTCNAYLHARKQGESFGIAIGEFSIKNKPILTWGGSDENSHLDILGDKALIYNNTDDLIDILLNFKNLPNNDWDCYSESYNCHAVMRKFKKVFID